MNTDTNTNTNTYTETDTNSKMVFIAAFSRYLGNNKEKNDLGIIRLIASVSQIIIQKDTDTWNGLWIINKNLEKMKYIKKYMEKNKKIGDNRKWIFYWILYDRDDVIELLKSLEETGKLPENIPNKYEPVAWGENMEIRFIPFNLLLCTLEHKSFLWHLFDDEIDDGYIKGQPTRIKRSSTEKHFFVFENISWSNIVLLFKLHFLNIDGGNGSQRHLFSATHAKLAEFLFYWYDFHIDLKSLNQAFNNPLISNSKINGEIYEAYINRDYEKYDELLNKLEDDDVKNLMYSSQRLHELLLTDAKLKREINELFASRSLLEMDKNILFKENESLNNRINKAENDLKSEKNKQPNKVKLNRKNKIKYLSTDWIQKEKEWKEKLEKNINTSKNQLELNKSKLKEISEKLAEINNKLNDAEKISADGENSYKKSIISWIKPLHNVTTKYQGPQFRYWLKSKNINKNNKRSFCSSSYLNKNYDSAAVSLNRFEGKRVLFNFFFKYRTIIIHKKVYSVISKTKFSPRKSDIKKIE